MFTEGKLHLAVIFILVVCKSLIHRFLKMEGTGTLTIEDLLAANKGIRQVCSGCKACHQSSQMGKNSQLSRILKETVSFPRAASCTYMEYGWKHLTLPLENCIQLRQQKRWDPSAGPAVDPSHVKPIWRSMKSIQTWWPKGTWVSTQGFPYSAQQWAMALWAFLGAMTNQTFWEANSSTQILNPPHPSFAFSLLRPCCRGFGTGDTLKAKQLHFVCYPAEIGRQLL